MLKDNETHRRHDHAKSIQQIATEDILEDISEDDSDVEKH